MDRYDLVGGDDLGPMDWDDAGGRKPLFRDEVQPGARSAPGSRSAHGARSARGARSASGAHSAPRGRAGPAADTGAAGRTRGLPVARSGAPAQALPGTKSRRRHTPRQRFAGWTALTATVLVVAVTLTAYLAYRHLLGNIGREDVNGLLGNRPPKYNSALNILIVGSDSRAGRNAQYGAGVQGARSDTMMLMHISPQRDQVTMISFPRDTMMQTLACQSDHQGHNGQQASSNPEMLNATFSYGGAPCLWKTLEAVTGIRIDHFVQLDFTGFQTMVNAVGGVNVCLPQAVNDPASKLNLSAGVHHVDGIQALAFVRERHIGEGSDLQRIQRQQYFMAALVKEALSSNVLSNPSKLYALSDAVTKSLTVDSQLSVGNMVQIAESMRSTSAGHVTFLSVPTVPDPGNSARVDLDPVAAPQLFNAIKYDTVTHTPAHKTTVKTTAKAKSKPSTPALKPSQVKVQVLNGSTVSGLASQTGSQLGQQGFDVTGTGNAAATATTTVIQYASPADLAAAQALQAALSSAQLRQASSLQPGTVDLVLGPGFQGLRPQSDLAKQYGGITGNTNICKDSSAFAGPDQPSDFGH